MALSAEGDRDAFAALVGRHQRSVLALAHRYLGDAAEAQDVGQEVFLRLWAAAARYRPDSPLPAYLRTLTVNLCLDRIRKPKLVPVESLPDPVGREDPAGSATASERGRILEEGLRQLPRTQRMAMVLFHYEGLSVKEVADHLETSPKAVESLLSRARVTLRDRLGRRLGES